MFLQGRNILWLMLISSQRFRQDYAQYQGATPTQYQAYNNSDYWKKNRRGANVFNLSITQDYIQEIKAKNINLIRLSPSKWHPAKKDFLIGDCDNYTEIPEEDFQSLKHVLDLCTKHGIKVILTMLSLPGCRWRQHNNLVNDQVVSDERIYIHEEFRQQAAKFYKDLVVKLNKHPAIVGYDLLNEPGPNEKWDRMSKEELEQVQINLHQLYKLCVDSIRSFDTETTIILESPGFADPTTFSGFRTINDPQIIYSFHMYEPLQLTNYPMNKGLFKYPGRVGDKDWDKEQVEEYMSPVEEFSKKNNIPPTQILLGEFGGNRRTKGLELYFQHILDYCRKSGYHALFYAIREDDWAGMDYEAGLHWKPQLNPRVETPAWKVLQQWLNEQELD